MKKKLPIVIIAVIALFVIGFISLKLLNIVPQTTVPADFNLVFRYGVGAKNELNTFDGTYTKDLVMDPPVTVDFKLTEEEIADIYKKMTDLEVFEITNTAEEGMFVTPCSSYYLKVQQNSVQKEMSWDGCSGKINDKLREFTDYVISIIESKDEYQELPDATGGYD